MANYTIKDFAEITKKTPQAIYKRFVYNKKNKKKYTIEEDGKILIIDKALSLYKIVIGQPIEDGKEIKEENPNDLPNNTNEVIEILKKQLEEKDKQINNLTQTIQGLTITNMNLNNKLLMIDTKENKSIFSKLFKRNKQEHETQEQDKGEQ